MAPSRLPSLNIPDTDVWSFLFERPSRPFPDDQVLFRHPTRDWNYTYSTVKSSASHFGCGLLAHWAWRKGDVLAVFSPNSIEVPVITWGTHYAGGVVSPANPGYCVRELAHHLQDSGAKGLVTTSALLPVALEAAKAVGLPHHRILLFSEDGEGDVDGGLHHWSAICRGQENADVQRVDLQPQDLAFLMYSSGTTGVPKGVELTHRNVVSNCCMVANVEGEDESSGREGLKSGRDKVLSVLPQYHIYGLQCLVHVPLYLGIEVIVPPSFTLPSFCEIVQRHKITYSYVAPPIVLHLAKNPLINNYNLSSLRMLTSSAAPLATDLILAVWDRLRIPVKQAYGLSETSPATHVQPWGDTWRTAMGSVGTLLPNLETLFVSNEGNAGVEGELWVRGPSVFRGYHNNPSATADSITHDGYFKTGDVGYEGKGGNLYITDRLKELIKYNGSQIAPAELEGLLHSHPMVEDVAVVGRYVEHMATEVPVAFLVRVGGSTETATADGAEIVAWMAERTAKTKWLRGGIIWVDEIPKSAAGKVLRRVLKEMLQDPHGPKAVAEKLHAGKPKL